MWTLVVLRAFDKTTLFIISVILVYYPTAFILHSDKAFTTKVVSESINEYKIKHSSRRQSFAIIHIHLRLGGGGQNRCDALPASNVHTNNFSIAVGPLALLASAFSLSSS